MVQSNRHATGIPKGIPGKLFVIPFVLTLVLLCFLMIAVAVRFQTIMSRLEESRSLWPLASLELWSRYEQIKEPEGNSRTGEKIDWEQSKRDFSGSTLFDKQSYASMVIESQISQSRNVSSHADAALYHGELASPNVSKLISAERRRKESQSGFIGWLTVRALRLKLPNIYDPLANKQ